MALSKEGILAAMQLKKETVGLDGGSVIVSELSAPDYVAVYESDLAKNEKGEFDGARFTALLVARCIVDEDGARIFADEDAEVLRGGSKRVYQKLCQAVNNVNGLNEDAIKN